MKRCLHCSAENPDAAMYCSACGTRLEAPAPGSSPAQPIPPADAGAKEGGGKEGGAEAGRTQPVRVARPGPAHTPPGAPASSSGQNPQAPGDTQPFAPQGWQGQSHAAPPSATQPVPTTYRPGPPPGGGAQAYSQQPYAPGYQPPAGGMPPGGMPPGGGPPPGAGAGRVSGARFWPLLIGALVLTLLCACGLALWTMTNAAGTGIANLGDRISTQAAEVLGPPPVEDTPVPTLVAEPTPWPTFTPAPPSTETPVVPTQPAPTQPAPPEPTPAADETEQATAERLLSPQCSAALDEMQRYSGELTTRPLQVLEPEWREGFSRALEDMNAACGSIDAASPVPGRLGDARRSLALANQSFDEATRLFGEGVTELNASKLLEAGRNIQEASNHLGEAISALREIGQ